MRLSFHGADRSVTGSCHLVECAGQRILIDCGLYQGGRGLSEENANPFGFDPASIDYLLLTHAHLDHCGRLPLLVREGFRGEIVTTAASRELARLVMIDAANLQEDEARRRLRSHRHNRRENNQPPLYSLHDAFHALEYFGRTAVYGHTLEIAPGIRATFIDAGHILGSASILLELEEGKQQRRVLFSGDIGNAGRPLLRDPTPPPKADIVVMETTYGNRLHRALQPSVEEFYAAVTATLARGGNVIIPTFALERTQELLYYLREGVENGILPRTLPIYLDSPMAISATEIFQRHPECYEAQTARLFHAGHDPLRVPGLRFTRETVESIAIGRIRGGAIIMAGSGMCSGGRVTHHLQNNLANERCSVIFVGFAAIGTLARSIIDGARTVRIHGEEVPVRAGIHTINGFSAHADQAELLAWHGHTGNPERTFLVHGEEETMRCFGALLKNTQVEMPELHQAFDL